MKRTEQKNTYKKELFNKQKKLKGIEKGNKNIVYLYVLDKFQN